MDRTERILRKYTKKLLEIQNVVGVGIGYKTVNGERTNKKSLLVLVKKKIPREKLRKAEVIPERVEDVNTDVIEVGEIKLLGLRTEKLRPARPGISIGHYKVTAGTFGALVRDSVTREPLILSNNHVLANSTNGRDKKASLGDPILQPGAYDGGKSEDVIGHLFRFIPVEKDMTQVECPVAKAGERILDKAVKILRPSYNVRFYKKKAMQNLVDAALAKPVHPSYVSDEILELGKVKGEALPELGLSVVKSGRTSGVTKSEIKAMNVVIKVMLGENEEATFYEQILTGPMAKPGDSGSLVLTEKNEAVGLLFAGSEEATLINPIINVMKLLKFTF